MPIFMEKKNVKKIAQESPKIIKIYRDMRACRKKNISSHHIALQKIKLIVDKNENAKSFQNLYD